MGIISFNKQIFVCGGWNGSESLNSVEKYSIETDTWQFVSPMNNSRGCFAIVTLGKHLYAIGGDGGMGRCLNTVNILINFYYFGFSYCEGTKIDNSILLYSILFYSILFLLFC